MLQYDIIVIGGGPGGYVAAIRAAQLGAKVCLIEKDKVGGVCLNRGCIPTKAIIACVNLYAQIARAENFGITTSNVSLDLKKIIARKNNIVAKIVKGVEFLLTKNQIEIIYGAAAVLNPGKVEATKPDGSKLSVIGSKLVLATGSSPIPLPGRAFDGQKFLSSDDLLNVTEIPPKLEIVGGGVIGIHFAHVYSQLGAAVTLYEARSEILSGIDEEIVAQIGRILKRKNISILTGARFDPAQSSGKTLICVGRTPNLAGLEELKLKMDGPSVWVNEKMETSLPGIYAVGDLASKQMLAHVAYEQGVVAAENALGKSRTFSYDSVPYGIYTHPEIAGVGLIEKEAREKHQNIKIGKFPYAALGIAQARGESEGFIKVIATESGRLLGIHIIGAEASSLIGAATLALRNGLSIEQLAATFQSHPSYPEGLHEAALSALQQSLHTVN